MSNKSKRIFLGICIIVPFAIYCYIYYSSMIRNAPFRFSDFESIELSYGYPDEMYNIYDSKTSDYQYLNKNDELVQVKLKMRKDDLLYLHRKAMELGFWNVKDDMTTDSEEVQAEKNILRYKLTYNYTEKSKTVVMDADYPGNPKMVGAAKSTIDEVIKMIADVQSR